MLTDKEIERLVDRLSYCQVVKQDAEYQLLVQSLPQPVQMSLKRANTLHLRLLHLVEACATYPGGLAWLRTRVRRLEGDSARAMSGVDDAFRELNSRLAPCFLVHHRDDRASAEAIARWLYTRGVACWLDSWNLTSDEPWPRPLSDALDECASCAILMSPAGRGPWHNEEMRAAIAERVADRSLRVIPVLLPGAHRRKRSHLPPFLRHTTWAVFERTVEESTGRAAILFGVRPGPVVTEPVKPSGDACPYLGLQAFRTEDA